MITARDAVRRSPSLITWFVRARKDENVDAKFATSDVTNATDEFVGLGCRAVSESLVIEDFDHRASVRRPEVVFLRDIGVDDMAGDAVKILYRYLCAGPPGNHRQHEFDIVPVARDEEALQAVAVLLRVGRGVPVEVEIEITQTSVCRLSNMLFDHVDMREVIITDLGLQMVKIASIQQRGSCGFRLVQVAHAGPWVRSVVIDLLVVPQLVLREMWSPIAKIVSADLVLTGGDRSNWSGD